MSTGCISFLASTDVIGAVAGPSDAIGCSCSGTKMGQGLSGVTTRNPDIPWYIERVRAMERNIKINRKSGKERERVGYNNMRRSLP